MICPKYGPHPLQDDGVYMKAKNLPNNFPKEYKDFDDIGNIKISMIWQKPEISATNGHTSPLIPVQSLAAENDY